MRFLALAYALVATTAAPLALAVPVTETRDAKRAALALPESVKAIAATNPGNTEGIFNRLVHALEARHGPEFPDTLHVIQREGDAGPAQKAIRGPFVHDVFKVMVDGTTLSGYDVADTILDSVFAREFNELIEDVNAIIKGNNEALGKRNTLLPGYVGLPHRDAFQLIPNWRLNFAGGLLSDVSILNNRVYSAGQLQAIFASDGAFRNLRIEGNKLQTASLHQITIAGMLSGTVTGNTDFRDNAVKVALLPMRLGGFANVFVLSFHPQSSYQYEPISGLAEGEDMRGHVHDRVMPNATYLRNFHMDNYLAAFAAATEGKNLPGHKRARLAGDLALQHGQTVSE